jgi:hypothetical protein
MPVSASEAAYARAAFGSDQFALAVGLLVVAIAIVSAAAISVGSAGYIGVFIDLPRPLVISAVVIAMGIVAAGGIVQSIRFAAIMTLLEIGGLLLIIIAGSFAGPEVVTRLPEVFPSPHQYSAWLGVMGGSLLAVFAFVGFEGVVNIASANAAARNLPHSGSYDNSLRCRNLGGFGVGWSSRTGALACAAGARFRTAYWAAYYNHERNRYRSDLERDHRANHHVVACALWPVCPKISSASPERG